MGIFDFKRYNGFTGNVPQHFIDNKYPKCPMCRTTDPHGPQKEKGIRNILGSRILGCSLGSQF